MTSRLAAVAVVTIFLAVVAVLATKYIHAWEAEQTRILSQTYQS